ncbi:MAG: winged helix-turn-helix domain-containing protein [Actinomycetota bacterium]|nr:winged helix-turn-helix domain-containing protein [Actinomycetota bacterium]
MATNKPAEPGRQLDGSAKPSWTFLTNHGHVLVCIAQDPGMRGRDIAERVGITERAAQAIIADLVAAGYVTRKRVGRRNSYEIHPDVPVRHPVEQPHRVGELLAALADVHMRMGKVARR